MNSVAKQGYIQREFRLALDTLEEMPPDAIHTIPIRLDDCQIPEQFRPLQWSDLSEAGEFDRIVQALRFGMEQRQHFTPKPALEPPPEPIPDRDPGAEGPLIAEAPESTTISHPEFTNSIGMEFVLIPAGTFMMGFPNSHDAYHGEKPIHRVKISQPFYLGKYPVTQAQWKAVMGNNPSHFKRNLKRPVEMVSWNDVQLFLRKLNEREGRGDYRLPTEAQWEYACRAGTETPRYHHDVNAIAWYRANSNNRTHPVGQKLPNAWGLYDMLGNVWEWCHEEHRKYYFRKSAPAKRVFEHRKDHSRKSAPAKRVFRGGGWYSGTGGVQAAYRDMYYPNFRHDDLGFRCSSSVPSK